MPLPKPIIAALIAGLTLTASAAGAQEPEEMPPADQPAEALPAPVEPPPPPVPSTVPPETLQRLARAADEVWRIAILATERPVDRTALRFGDRVAITQADLGRRIGELARSQGDEVPDGPAPEARQRMETLRAQPPEALLPMLAALVRQSYPGMVETLEGWADGPEHAVAEALLPPLREELEQAGRVGAPALTGSSGIATGTASPR